MLDRSDTSCWRQRTVAVDFSGLEELRLATASSSFSTLRPVIITFAADAARKDFAISYPIPDAPPVIRMVRPA